MSGKARTRLLVFGILFLFVIGFFLPRGKPQIEFAPEALFHVGGYTITNTILTAWVSIIVWAILVFLATRRLSLVPKGMQNLLEAVLEWWLGIVEDVAGKKWGRRFFPAVTSIFLFVVLGNWLSLLPGFGTIGLKVGHGEETILHPFLRNPNTDLNTTLGLALVSLVLVWFWGFWSLGFKGYMSKFFNFGSLLHGKLFEGVLDIFIGLLELISEVGRTIAFTFRLFGNMFAGEVLLIIIAFLVPFVVPVLFYGLEVFVGFLQAVVFAALTLVFGALAVASHGEHDPSREGHS